MISDIFLALRAQNSKDSLYLFNDSHYYIPEQDMHSLNGSVLITGNQYHPKIGEYLYPHREGGFSVYWKNGL